MPMHPFKNPCNTTGLWPGPAGAVKRAPDTLRRLSGFALACATSLGLWACGGGDTSPNETIAQASAVTPAESAHDTAMGDMTRLGLQAPAEAAGGLPSSTLGLEGAGEETLKQTPARKATTLQADGGEAGSAPSTQAAAVTGPYVERVQLIANDGTSENSPLPNHWGLHQPRITVHTDGTIRALYMRKGTGDAASWRLLKRSPATGVWALEASGSSVDDVTLMRDPVSDVAHVVMWPNSVPKVQSSPYFVPVSIPGYWQVLGAAARHYGNTGIGSDGKLCLKASVELAATIPTTNTQTYLTCGRYNAVTRAWAFDPQIVKSIGLRRAYDYLLPGGLGDARQMVATAQVDVYKTALGLQSLSLSQGNYVFNGISAYNVAMDTGQGWTLSSPVPGLAVSKTTTVAPIVRLIDAYTDSSRRLLSLYFVSDPAQAASRGLYLRVSDYRGQRLFQGRLTGLPTYGYARVFEDAQSRLWVLWTSLGPQMTHMVLHRLQLGSAVATLTNATDLSASFSPYVIQGAPFLAVPRGGQAVGNTVAGLMVACDGVFAGTTMPNCYPTLPNRQKLVHFSLRLPD